MDILKLIASNNYFIFNKDIAKRLSTNCAIILGLFCNKYNFYKQTNQLTIINGKGYFYCTRDDIYEETGLKDDCQRSAMRLLKQEQILEVKRFGVPSKNYYYINEEKLAQTLDIVSPSENKGLDIGKTEDKSFEKPTQLIDNTNIDNSNIDNINIINGKNLDIENEIKEKEKQKRKSKKMQNAILINQMLDNFTTNDEIKDYLKQYLDIRRKKGLTPDQWKIILDDLRKECGTNKSYALEKIKRAIAGGWMQIIYIDTFSGKPKSRYSSKPNFDNTASHDVPKGVASMTDSERQNFIDNELARDENGNLLKF